MNDYQKLRYFTNLYGERIGIADLYSKMKKIWKIKSSKDFKPKTLNIMINMYQIGLNGLENHIIDPKEEKERIEKLITKHKKTGA